MAEDLEKCFQTLGIDQHASPEQAKEAWKDLVQVWHPDKHVDSERRRLKAEKKIKEINTAYDIVKKHLESRHKESHSRQEQGRASQGGQRRAEEEERSRAERARREADSRDKQAKERTRRAAQRSAEEGAREREEWEHGAAERERRRVLRVRARLRTIAVLLVLGAVAFFIIAFDINVNRPDKKAAVDARNPPLPDNTMSIDTTASLGRAEDADKIKSIDGYPVSRLYEIDKKQTRSWTVPYDAKSWIHIHITNLNTDSQCRYAPTGETYVFVPGALTRLDGPRVRWTYPSQITHIFYRGKNDPGKLKITVSHRDKKAAVEAKNPPLTDSTVSIDTTRSLGRAEDADKIKSIDGYPVSKPVILDNNLNSPLTVPYDSQSWIHVTWLTDISFHIDETSEHYVFRPGEIMRLDSPHAQGNFPGYARHLFFRGKSGPGEITVSRIR